jgi:hypothetical protein
MIAFHLTAVRGCALLHRVKSIATSYARQHFQCLLTTLHALPIGTQLTPIAFISTTYTFYNSLPLLLLLMLS